MTTIKCCECNKPGGTVPLHYSDGVVEMLHDECAVQRMERYFREKDLKVEHA